VQGSLTVIDSAEFSVTELFTLEISPRRFEVTW